MNVKDMIEILEPLPEDMSVVVGIQSLSEVTGNRGIREIQFVGIESNASPHKDIGVEYEKVLCFYIEDNNRVMNDAAFIPTALYREMVKERRERAVA